MKNCFSELRQSDRSFTTIQDYLFAAQFLCKLSAQYVKVFKIMIDIHSGKTKPILSTFFETEIIEPITISQISS